ncbi:TPA: putative zinc ribbon protein [Klebsiella pneumoniae]
MGNGSLRNGSEAMRQFSPIEHAITEDGEWVTVQEVPYRYNGRLLCDSCYTEVIIQEDALGQEIFVHARRNRRERLNTQGCRYAISPSRRAAPVRPAGRGERNSAFRGPLNTRTRNWRCTRCEYSYFGGKKCPRCNDWVYTVSR